MLVQPVITVTFRSLEADAQNGELFCNLCFQERPKFELTLRAQRFQFSSKKFHLIDGPTPGPVEGLPVVP